MTPKYREQSLSGAVPDEHPECSTSNWAARRRWTLVFALLGPSLSACSKDDHKPPPAALTDAGDPKPSTPNTCDSPNVGCPCDEPGKTVSCGEVIFKSADYVTCSIGTRTCGENDNWGVCAGQQIVTLNAWQTHGLRPSAQPGGTASGNTCDPFLFQINADLSNGDGGIGTGVQLADGGVELAPVTGVMGGCVGTQHITITPDASPATDLQITTVATPPTPNSVQFSAALPTCAGVGSAPIWTVDQPSVATIDSSGKLTLQYPYVGPIQVTAYAGGISAVVTVHVTVAAVDTSKVTNGGPIATSFLSTCGVP